MPQGHNTSPLTNVRLADLQLTPNIAIKKAIDEWSTTQVPTHAFRQVSAEDVRLNVRQLTFAQASAAERASAPVFASASETHKQQALLGMGQDKTVFRAWWNGRDVAVLYLRNATCGTEAEIFSLLGRHPHLVTFYGAAEFLGKQMLITELVSLGSLDIVVDKHSTVLRANPSLWKGMILEMLAQVSSGMARIAEAGVLHRDLALRNILAHTFDATTGRVLIKVSDFGLSKQGMYYYAAANAVPVRWTAPEALGNRNKFSVKSDVYSLGVVVWELLGFAQRMPHWEVQDEDRLTQQLVEGSRSLSKPSGGDDDIWAVAQRCLRREVSARPCFEDLRVELRQLAMEHRLVQRQLKPKSEEKKRHLFGGVAVILGLSLFSLVLASMVYQNTAKSGHALAVLTTLLSALLPLFLWLDTDLAFLMKVSVLWWRTDPHIIVADMQRHINSAKVQEYGCWALAKLAYKGAASREAIVRSGGINACVSAMCEYRGQCAVQTQGCRALRNLSVNSKANRISIADQGGIKAVVAAARGHRWNAEVQKWACWALGNLAYGNVSNQLSIGDHDGVEGIFASMREHWGIAAVQQAGCGALANLAMNDAIKVTIADKGGIEIVFQAMWEHRGSPLVQENGCAAMANLAAGSERNQLSIADKGGIEALVAGMNEHRSNVQVVEKGCGALLHISWSSLEQQERVKAAGGEACLLQALATPGATATTLEMGRALLQKLEKVGQVVLQPER